MKKKIVRYFAFFMALNIIFEVISPSLALALTNGPVQPEHASFQQASVSEMVDLFTGDFNYNIPLMEVDGYPINIAYQAGQKTETEASWVGLGWSLNPGVMTRMMRGLPDDFNGDQVKTETNIRENITVGVGFQTKIMGGASAGYKNFGAGISAQATVGALLNYNNYTGHSLQLQLDMGASAGVGISLLGTTILTGGVSAGMGLRVSSAEGASMVFYKGNSYSILNVLKGGHYWKDPMRVSSVQNSTGTSINTRTGSAERIYSQSTSSTSWKDAVMGRSSSESRSATVPVGSIAYSPRVNHSFLNTASSESKMFGFYGCAPALPFAPWLMLEGALLGGFPKHKTSSVLADANKSLSSYGYMNLENSDNISLMDFNRHREGVYMREAPNGSYAVLTNDIFISSAQGMSSTFRAHRSDYGTVHDPYVQGQSTSTGSHKALGLGVIFYREKGQSNTFNFNSDGNWANSPILNQVKFYKPNPNKTADRFYEKFFFKEIGESTPVDVGYEGSGGGQGASKPSLTVIGNEYVASQSFSGARRSSRVIRNNHISSRNAAEANDRALVKAIRNFQLNTFGVNPDTRAMRDYENLSRTGFNGLSGIDHHLSEMTVTKDDGTRYVYGIPVYNKLKKTVVFNASDYDGTSAGPYAVPNSNPIPKSDYLKLVQYTSTDASAANDRGLDNYYNKEEIPAYVSSFLLTSIISPDYVDLKGDGPTKDDLGTYMLFNYTNTNEYKWRGPYNVKSGATHEENLSGATKNANLIEGLQSDELDDKGTYEYGVRENWYLHSVESKNYEAEFEIDTRDDNCGVANEDGSLAPNTSYKLKQIRLYTKEEKIKALLNSSIPVPIKTVTFEYDYSLCKNVYNGTSGKLTLKKIYFAEGSSRKLALSPYKFTYCDNDHNGIEDSNPDYDPRAVDRWGSYKVNDPQLNNSDFPYAEQDQSTSNQYAASWNLTSIETPSGSKTDVYYEADDYAYVQDEPCAAMLKIKGFYTSINKNNFDLSIMPPLNKIYSGEEILVDLEDLNTGISTSLSSTQADALVKSKMFPTRKHLYMKCKTLLADANTYPGVIKKSYWEYVPCYGTVKGSGIIKVNGLNNTYTNANGTFYKYAWVKINLESKDGLVGTFTNPVNPVSKAGWEMVRTQMPKLAFPGSQPNAMVSSATPLQTFFDLKAGLGVALQDHLLGMVKSQNLRMYRRGYCEKVDYNLSWLRAYTPYKKKIGDGYRVKKIISRDNWDASGVGETYSDYGQEYDYTKTEGLDKISSGVASYEPLVGGDENSMHQPIKFTYPRSYAPDDHYFQETPYLENLYPNAFVGYSKVTIRNIDHEYSNGANPPDKVCQIGKTVYEFYTAKDFPIIERRGMFEKQNMNNLPLDAYTIAKDLYNIEYASQGFAVKLNDMHGKLKSACVYGEDNPYTPISGVSYYYKSSPINATGGKELIQEVATIDEDLAISNQSISRNIDVTTDLRYSGSINLSVGTMKTVKMSICNPIPKRDFDFSLGSTQFGLGTASTTKVISQHGILYKTESFSQKANTVDENLLWDKKTGQVILSKHTNNFDQAEYAFDYPAYWIYKKMGHKYSRHGISYLIDLSLSTPIIAANGDLTNTGLLNIFHPGDEVFISKELSGQKVGDRFWIVENHLNANLWRLMDVNGNIFDLSHPDLIGNNQNLVFKIDRPIERNTQSFNTANVITLHNPLQNVPNGILPILNKQVINASSEEYCELWDYYKGNTNSQVGPTFPQTYDNNSVQNSGNPLVNPYSANQLGCWRPWKSFSYNDTRTYSSSQPNNKTDGIYSTYVPYWTNTGGNGWQPIMPGNIGYDNWVKQTENYIYSPYGYIMEAHDAKNIPQSQRYGFNHTLPVLKASRASVMEVGYDGFEEYENLYPSYLSINNPQIISNDYLGFYRQMNTSLSTNSAKPSLSGNEAHTGRFSANFSTNQSVVLTHDIKCMLPVEMPPPPHRCEYSGLFELNRLWLDYNFKYIVSFWIKSKSLSSNYSNVFTFGAQVKDPINNVAGNATLIGQQTTIINGWQKFDYEISFPAVTLSLKNNAIFTITAPPGSPGFYLDDFRLQPYNSNMSCSVYDPKTLKPWAQLDDRNFATFLEYDNEGTLVRMKRETVKGVFTVNEIRKNLKK